LEKNRTATTKRKETYAQPSPTFSQFISPRNDPDRRGAYWPPGGGRPYQEQEASCGPIRRCPWKSSYLQTVVKQVDGGSLYRTAIVARGKWGCIRTRSRLQTLRCPHTKPSPSAACTTHAAFQEHTSARSNNDDESLKRTESRDSVQTNVCIRVRIKAGIRLLPRR
jgi:hypothetical protein